MRKKCFIFFLSGMLLLSLGQGKAQAFIFINEFLADPAGDLAGDANNDGTRDAYDDEFVELFNLSPDSVDISNWTLSDATDERYSFAADTWIQANSAFVVFGGGSPILADSIDWQVLTTGNLNLNNGGDTITLRDATGLLIDSYTYGTEAGYDQSITRSPEGSKGEWVKHTLLANADGKLFSPGYLVNDVPSSSTVPEPATVLSLSLGLGAMLIQRRK
jgi:hypothetical protein